MAGHVPHLGISDGNFISPDRLDLTAGMELLYVIYKCFTKKVDIRANIPKTDLLES